MRLAGLHHRYCCHSRAIAHFASPRLLLPRCRTTQLFKQQVQGAIQIACKCLADQGLQLFVGCFNLWSQLTCKFSALGTHVSYFLRADVVGCATPSQTLRRPSSTLIDSRRAVQKPPCKVPTPLTSVPGILQTPSPSAPRWPRGPVGCPGWRWRQAQWRPGHGSKWPWSPWTTGLRTTKG